MCLHDGSDLSPADCRLPAATADTVLIAWDPSVLDQRWDFLLSSLSSSRSVAAVAEVMPCHAYCDGHARASLYPGCHENDASYLCRVRGCHLPSVSPEQCKNFRQDDARCRPFLADLEGQCFAKLIVKSSRVLDFNYGSRWYADDVPALLDMQQNAALGPPCRAL